jgi:hypothetical protein
MPVEAALSAADLSVDSQCIQPPSLNANGSLERAGVGNDRLGSGRGPRAAIGRHRQFSFIIVIDTDLSSSPHHPSVVGTI